MTRRFAVLGSPIEHSKSPLIHNFVFEQSGFDASYERFEVSELSQFLDTHGDFSGFSLTMPLKDQAFVISSSTDPSAAITKSVNTLLPHEGGWHGYNTDVYGIQQAVGLEPVAVAVIGSGATARSALAAFPGASKFIYARNQAAARELALEFSATVVDLETALNAQAVVSTVPKGVLPDLVGSRELPGTLLDCAYTNPEVAARHYVSGLVMLCHQAIMQQRIFQNSSPDLPLENEAALVSGVLTALSMAK
jgi:shikimate dehydrogenase